MSEKQPTEIVVFDGYAANPGDILWADIAALGTLRLYDRTAPQDVITRLGGAQAVLTNKVLITKEVMAACPRLRYIGVLATGYNVVDVAEAKRRKITVTNIPNYSSESVAQHTFALLLEICNQVGHHAREVGNGRWLASKDFCFWDAPLTELSGKTMGLIGFGHIGQKVAQIAEAFGMEVLFAAQRPHPALSRAHCQNVSPEEIFEKADIISLHCPLTAENEGFIDRTAIARMKDGVVLINTARGPLIDEAAVAEACESGKIKAYGADVVSKEPMEAHNPLLGARHVYITPHIAWAPRETRERLMHIAAENLRAYLAGKPVNVVS